MASPAPSIDGIPLASLPATPTRAASADPCFAPLKRERGSAWRVVRGGLRGGLSLPVAYQEPLSFLQRLAEDVEHSALLDRAAAAGTGPALRAALVAAFAVSHVAATRARALQPFNPLLGETFEAVLPAQGVALLAEQTSHHPPVSALHAQGAGWVLRETQQVRTKLHPAALEAWPAGEVFVEFPGSGERFAYTKPRCYVAGLARGPLWLDNAGRVVVQETRRGELLAVLDFRRAAGRKAVGEVSGHVARAAAPDKPVCDIRGNWTSHVDVDGERVWAAHDRPGPACTRGHALSAWAWALNAEPAAGSKLPCTDSRWRPDQRLLEQGRFKDAQRRKKEIEDAQRRRLGAEGGKKDGAKDGGAKAGPRWFVPQGDAWVYAGGYFTQKAEGWPPALPRIFDTGE